MITKRDLMLEYNSLCDKMKMRIDGIYNNCNKDTIQNAIDCLKCDDKTLDDYMTVIKLKYPNTHRTISSNGDYKRHPFNRLYVYNTARLIVS
jgi:hypothetical protein